MPEAFPHLNSDLGSVPIGALASAGLHLASVLGIVVVMLWITSLPGRH